MAVPRSFSSTNILFLQPGMIPVAVIGSAAPVSFIATSSAPMMATSGNSTNNSRHHKNKKTKNAQEKQESNFEPPPEVCV